MNLFHLKKETFVKIIEKYVNYLIENQYRELVAFYLTNLPSDFQIKIYSKLLASKFIPFCVLICINVYTEHFFKSNY